MAVALLVFYGLDHIWKFDNSSYSSKKQQNTNSASTASSLYVCVSLSLRVSIHSTGNAAFHAHAPVPAKQCFVREGGSRQVGSDVGVTADVSVTDAFTRKT